MLLLSTILLPVLKTILHHLHNVHLVVQFTVNLIQTIFPSILIVEMSSLTF